MEQKAKQYKTTFTTKKEAQLAWYIFDAEGKTLGRFASEIAKILRGKHKPSYTPYIDTGDGVIVINADKIAVTGAKEANKIYHKHTGHPGGLREKTLRTVRATEPKRILADAILGMMPATRLGRQQGKKLRLFVGTEHGMEAQNPIKVNI
jgi:large subunit ribosomal protein L13